MTTLRDLRAKAEAATPGPWTFKPEGFYFDMEHSWTVVAPDGETRICMEPTDFSAYPSGSFISPDGVAANGAFFAAASPDVVLALVRSVEELRAALEIMSAASNEKLDDPLTERQAVLLDAHIRAVAALAAHDARWGKPNGGTDAGA